MRESILVVDDEAGVRSSLAGILGDEGYVVEAVDSGEACLATLESGRRYDLLLLDVWLPKMDGLETLSRVRALDPELPVVVISGHGSIESAVKAVRLGARDFVEKPLSLEKTLLVVKNALRQQRLEVENRALKEQVEHRWVMVGDSPVLRALRADIAVAAPSNGRALIFGENGTGKELVARNIHFQSLRAQGPFVEVNCAAIPEELIESELFGHTRGAFTGALTAKKGKFEVADGGTIFLDEVGDMSLRTQAKVLRVLQEGEVERIGSQKTIQVDVRVIAATNKNLEEAIEKGEFREDLYFRLSVIPIQVPALRERSEDIAPLVEHFLAQFSAENNIRRKTVSPEAMAVLKRHPWRGNVRELKNTIERLMIMVPQEQIGPEHLALVLRRPAESGSAGAAAEAPGSLKDFKESAERAFLVQKLRESRWNISATAAAIGTPRSNLYKKLEHYGISQEKDG
jgi:two-component system, NtrC family, nitrogen regulation response regulator NtrX